MAACTIRADNWTGIISFYFNASQDPFTTMQPVTDDIKAQVTYFLCGPFLACFILIGWIGNAWCLYVFQAPASAGSSPVTSGTHAPASCTKSAPPGKRARRRRPITPANVYLLTLAAWDMTLLSASFLLYTLPALTDSTLVSDPSYVRFLPYAYYAVNSAHTCCIWCTVALGVERYFALCHPFAHRLSNGRRRAVYVVCTLSFLGALYNTPRLYEASVYDCAMENTTEVTPVVIYNGLQQNAYYRLIYKVVGGMCFYSLGPFTCLLFVSLRVWTAIRQQSAFQASTTRRSQTVTRNTVVCTEPSRGLRRQSTITRAATRKQETGDSTQTMNVMLISVVAKLLVAHLVPTALDVAEASMGNKAFATNNIVAYLSDVSIMLVVLNSCCNFFIYYICSRQFRDEIRKALQTVMKVEYCMKTFGRREQFKMPNVTTVYGEVLDNCDVV